MTDITWLAVFGLLMIAVIWVGTLIMTPPKLPRQRERALSSLNLIDQLDRAVLLHPTHGTWTLSSRDVLEMDNLDFLRNTLELYALEHPELIWYWEFNTEHMDYRLCWRKP